MSRTYKDAPYEVQAWRLRNTWQAYVSHGYDCVKTERYFFRRGHDPKRACNINDYDPRLRHQPKRWAWDSSECSWVLTGYIRGGVPSDFVSYDYHRPQRRDVRDKSRKAVKDWNGSGDTDVDIVNRQARNSSRWNWW